MTDRSPFWKGRRSSHGLAIIAGVLFFAGFVVWSAYAGASALFASWGLAAVGWSLVIQGRQSQAFREQTLRGQHHDLIKLSIEDRRLRPSWGGAAAVGTELTDDRMDQLGYANMIVSFWRSNYRLGSLGDDEIRSNFRRYFAGEIGREHWRNAREIDRVAARSRRGRRFWTIADEEYQRAVASGPPTVSAAFATPRGRRERLARFGLVAGGVAGGVGLSVLSRFVRRRQRT